MDTLHILTLLELEWASVCQPHLFQITISIWHRGQEYKLLRLIVWVLNLAIHFLGSMSLSELLKLNLPQFRYLQNSNNVKIK